MSERSAVEDIKEASRYLRGTLAEELTDAAAHFSADNTNLLKFHGIYQQDDRDQRRARTAKREPLAYVCMVRTSVPGGVVSADQWLAMDALTDKLSDGTLRLTTRQGVQFHFVAKDGLRPLISTLNEHLITTKGACGDVVRNVCACPAPHRERDQQALLEAAQAIAARFRPRTEAYYELWVAGEKAVTAEGPGESASDRGSNGADAAASVGSPQGDAVEPIYGTTYLPRKFKIGLAFPGDNCIDVYSQDVGIVPDGDGYVILAGGGLGLAHAREDDTYPRLATPVGWVPASKLGEAVEAIVTVQRDFGNREDRHRARLKYTIDDRGLDWFRGAVESRLGFELGPAPELAWADSDEHLGWHRQDRTKWFLGVHVDSGRVRDDETVQLRSALREIVQRFGPEVRITARQDVLLCGLPTKVKPQVEEILARYHVPLAAAMRPLQRLAMACPALPTCGQALGEAERVMPQLVDGLDGALAAEGLADLPVRVNVTGCPNGCARPYTAEIGIVGRTKSTYDLYVGGAIGGDRLAQRVAKDVPLGDIPKAFAPLFARYRTEARDGEGFGDFCDRTGVEQLVELVPRFERRRAPKD
jgi:sulfite reductase (ferredoxin)